MTNLQLAAVGDALARTRTATAMALRRRDGQLVFAAVSAAYLLVYLWAIGHLAAGLGGFGVTIVDDPLSTLLQSDGTVSFRPVASVVLGPVTYLASLNTLLGSAVAALVGLNLALSYLAWRQPAACGIGQSSSGLVAGIPALLSGTACCGPVVLIAVGIQASSALLTAFQFLLPAAVLMLFGSLLLVGRRITVGSAKHPSAGGE